MVKSRAKSPGVNVGLWAPARKLGQLLRLAKRRKRALIVTHDNPDPDALAAACALAYLLEKKAKLKAQVAYGGIIGRAENVALVKELKLDVVPVSSLDVQDFDLTALVDTQQTVGNHALPGDVLADIVIDHHPLRDGATLTPFSDLGGAYGATSTVLVEYLRASKLHPPEELATALYYGIKADTRDLERQTQDKDIDCYLWLFPQINRMLLHRIEHPQLPVAYFRLYRAAIDAAEIFSSAVITDLGEVYSPDMVAEVSERLSFLEDMTWSLAVGSYRSQLFVSLRGRDRRFKAGRLIRDVCADFGGSAGGHGTMAGARIPLFGSAATRLKRKRNLLQRFREAFSVAGEKPKSIPLSE